MKTVPDDVNSIEYRVKHLIHDHLGVPLERVISEATIEGNLGADSLDAVELVMAVEEEFKVEIPDYEAEPIVSVAGIIELVVRKTKQ